MELKLTRSTLRSLRAEDAVSLARYLNDKRVSRQLSDRYPHPYTLAHAQGFIAGVRTLEPPTCFAIAVGDCAVGVIGLDRQSDVNRCSAELGYWVGVDYWGQGIATEAIGAISRWAMDALDLVRIFAQPYADNVGSCRALEKAGFVQEGMMRCSAIKGGVIRDQRLYARLR
ncbi:MAG TPA: GNAT family N-acetyltransferase [Steroidobacteraceae bacterium]